MTAGADLERVPKDKYLGVQISRRGAPAPPLAACSVR